jgi:hypothetical protein
VWFGVLVYLKLMLVRDCAKELWMDYTGCGLYVNDFFGFVKITEVLLSP